MVQEQAAPVTAPETEPDTTASVREKTARPTTARAAPPRVARRPDADDAAAALMAAEQENQRLMSDVARRPLVPIIREGARPADDDGDALFQVTPVAVADAGASLAPVSASTRTGSASKGSLTQQLLATKSELEGASETLSPAAVGGGGHGAVHEAQDVEKLRSALQALSRSANPLSRVLDALQEDVDVMLTELASWTDELDRNTSLLREQKGAVDGEVQSMTARLDSLDQEIADQSEKIAASKAAIHKHEEKMRRVIALVLEKP